MPSLDFSWNDQSLRNTALDYFGSGDDADQPREVRFLRGVARLVRKRLKKGNVGEEAVPAVFLLLPRIPSSVAENSAIDRYPMLDNGRSSIAGRIWFVGPMVNNGTCVPLKAETDDLLFTHISSDLALGEVPAVLFEPRTDEPELRYYKAGMGDPDDCLVIPVGRGVVGLDEVFAVIDHVYDKKLITPDAQSAAASLWQDADKHWPIRLAEVTVQMYLDTALNIAFPWCRIADEQPGISGRTDIEIEEVDHVAGATIRHVLLELKVLRDFGSTGRTKSEAENLNWIDEGVEQASSYAKERGTLAKALCCFDMRKAPANQHSFSHVEEKAARLSVALRSWRLHATAKAYRKEDVASSA